MAQLDLFGTGPRILVDDATGSIVYHPAALSPARARDLFDELMTGTQWRHERRQMYDREVDVPRLVSSVSIEEPLPELLALAVPIVERLAGARFSSIGLNLYRDGEDSVAPHNDTLGELTPGAPIALLSLGATRRMTIRTKDLPRRALDLDLDAGSVLVMSYETQRTYNHGIPKTTQTVGPRISVAFRSRLQPR